MTVAIKKTCLHSTIGSPLIVHCSASITGSVNFGLGIPFDNFIRICLFVGRLRLLVLKINLDFLPQNVLPGKARNAPKLCVYCGK